MGGYTRVYTPQGGIWEAYIPGYTLREACWVSYTRVYTPQGGMLGVSYPCIYPSGRY